MIEPATAVDLTCDLVCVGGGLGGLSAAAVGATLGLDVVVVEATDWLGGVAAYSGGVIFAPNNHLAREAGLADSPELAQQYVEYLGSSNTDQFDEEMRAALLANVPRAVAFLAGLTEAYVGLTGLNDQYYPSAPGSVPGARTIEVAIAATALGKLAELVRRSPYYASGITHRDELSGRRDSPKLVPTQDGDSPADPAALRREVPARFTKGMGLVAALARDAFVVQDARYMLSTRAVDLLQQDGRVTGIVATDAEGTERRIRASRGVLIATGSYGAAPYAARMEGLPALKEQAPPVIHGDGLALTDKTSAALVRAGAPFITLGHRSGELHLGTDEPVYFPVYQFLGLPHSLVVNRFGQRFGDESFYGTFAGSIAQYNSVDKDFTNYPAFLIVDDEFRRRYGAVSPSGTWPTEEMTQAPTLAELAEHLGIDADGLVAQVSEFNADAGAGTDHRFGRGTLTVAREFYGDPRQQPNPNLGPVAGAPFWGLRLEIVGVGIYSHGVLVDQCARVLTRDRDVVPGLYATGNAVAYADVPFGYENGLANARNVTYALLAAEHASGKRVS